MADVKVAEIQPGHRYIWLHTPRGGYGFRVRLPVIALRVYATRVTVRVEASGKVVTVGRRNLVVQDMRGVDVSAERLTPEERPI